MKIREEVFRTITDCFKQHGANTIDTPAMELTVGTVSLDQRHSQVVRVFLDAASREVR